MEAAEAPKAAEAEAVSSVDTPAISQRWLGAGGRLYFGVADCDALCVLKRLRALCVRGHCWSMFEGPVRACVCV